MYMLTCHSPWLAANSEMSSNPQGWQLLIAGVLTVSPAEINEGDTINDHTQTLI